MTNTRVLLLILGFVALTFGSFVYYVATWDSAEKESLSSIHFGKQTQIPTGATL